MDGTAPTYDELLDLTRRQACQINELRAEVERLKAELEQSRRAGKRQATPFSKGPPKAHPKRPGRKAGHPPSHLRYLCAWLRARGLTPQKPQRVPRQRDPETIAAWLRTEWPRLNKRPGDRGPRLP